MGYIYLRKNLTNGKCYVGQTVDIERRNNEWNNLNFRYGGHVINNARKKYGTDGFSFEILKECQNEDMNYWEMCYIKMYNSKKPYGYNSTDGGDSIYEMTDEVRKKISAARRGRKLSDEAKAKLSAAMRGRKQSTEFIEKRVTKLRGKPNPKVAAALRGRKRPDIAAALRGRKHSEESKQKMSAAQRGKSKPKVAAALRGRKRPDIAAALRGRKQSSETIEKRAAARSKAIQALDKEGNVVYEFASAAEAGRHGFNQSHVAACCRGEEKTHKGLIWRYSEK